MNVNIGDRVQVFYREHSIPTWSHGEVVNIEGDYVTVAVDDNIFETGDNKISVKSEFVKLDD